MKLDCISVREFDRDDLVASLDLIDDLNARRHFAEAGVLAIKMRSAFAAMANKELRATRVFARVRHRKHSAVVPLVCARSLALDLVTRSTRT